MTCTLRISARPGSETGDVKSEDMEGSFGEIVGKEDWILETKLEMDVDGDLGQRIIHDEEVNGNN